MTNFHINKKKFLIFGLLAQSRIHTMDAMRHALHTSIENIQTTDSTVDDMTFK